MEISIWNPDAGEDYVLDDFDSGESFSSLALNLYALELVGCTGTDERCDRFLTAMLDSSPELFVIIIPWLRKNAYEEAIAGSIDIDYSLPNFRSSLKQCEKLGARLLSIRSDLGGGDSGEWIFVGSMEPVVLSDAEVEEGLSAVLQRDFDFVIYMAESNRSFQGVISRRLIRRYISPQTQENADDRTHHSRSPFVSPTVQAQETHQSLPAPVAVAAR